MKLVNEYAVSIPNNYLKNAYKFDYFVQVDLSTVNGLTLRLNKDLPPKSKELKPIANLFLKFHHKDMDKLTLTNKNEEMIVLQINETI